jgi:hypothetical protein
LWPITSSSTVRAGPLNPAGSCTENISFGYIPPSPPSSWAPSVSDVNYFFAVGRSNCGRFSVRYRMATMKLRGYLKRAFPFPEISGDTRGNGSLDWFSGHRVHSASMYQDARQRGVSILFKTGAVGCDGLRAADLRGYRLFLLRISADGSWNQLGFGCRAEYVAALSPYSLTVFSPAQTR